MANDLAYLARRMQQLSKNITKNAPRAVGTVVTAIGPVVVYGTPVDTSRARVNWQPAIGHVPTGVLFPYPDKPPAPDYGGREAVRAIVATAKAYPGGSYIAVVNNAPYIQKLNNGWSAQAPAAFVQQAVMVGIRSLNGFRILRDVN